MYLEINDSVINVLKGFVQDEIKKPEAGGIILGYAQEDNNYIITDASVPGKGDKGSRFSFTRNRNRAQEIINYHFKLSKGKKIYLGEWHTHPENNPNPSNLDIRELEKQYRTSTLNSEVIFMVIVGYKSTFVGKMDKTGFSPFLSIPGNKETKFG